MRQPPQSRAFWFYWGMAIGALLGGAVVFMSLQTISGWCGTEANCGREWFAASGTWMAVIAAIPPVYFLIQQIETSNRQHRRTQWSERRQTRSLAVAVQGSSLTIINVKKLVDEIIEEGTDREATLAQIGVALGHLEAMFDDRRFSQAEDDIAPPKRELGAIVCKRSIAFGLQWHANIDKGSPLQLQNEEWDQFVSGVRDITERCRDYAVDMTEVCKTYIEETDALIAGDDFRH